jgi:hypothetical protein
MTVKQKATNEARELIDKHYVEISDLSVLDETLDQIAINQALITVDNMLALLDKYDEEMSSTGQYDYWMLVRMALCDMGRGWFLSHL